jgi:hypothetical protein
MTDPDPFNLAELDAANPAKPAREIPAHLVAQVAPIAADPAPRPRQKRAKFSRQDLTRHKATCVTCGASNDKRNAQAWAAGHVNSNGGHRVALVLESVVADRELDETERLAVLDEAATVNVDGRASDEAAAENRRWHEGPAVVDRASPDPTMRDSAIVAADQASDDFLAANLS